MAYTPNASDVNNPVGSTPIDSLPLELRTIKIAIQNLKETVASEDKKLQDQITETDEALEALINQFTGENDRWKMGFFDATTTTPSESRQWGFTLKALDAGGGEKPIFVKGGFILMKDNIVNNVPFTTPFPTKCVYATATKWLTTGKRTVSDIQIVADPMFNKNQIGIQNHEGDAPVVWLAIGY